MQINKLLIKIYELSKIYQKKKYIILTYRPDHFPMDNISTMINR